jgi:divalent metal cation (Fe/Co/Zn/Cd) transporter
VVLYPSGEAQEGAMPAESWSEETLKDAIEALREHLHRMVGEGYSPEKIRKARQLSKEIDRLVVAYMELQNRGYHRTT